jgi:hypothetical protein
MKRVVNSQGRQGDVFLQRVTTGIPADARVVPAVDGKIVLVQGVATGHAHTARGSVSVYEKDGRTFLSVGSSAVVEHDEHAPLRLEGGTYEVVRQREYAFGWQRTVAD